ncbi:N-acetylneuraminate synthase family protein [Campylobacter hyointestinalis]|uniref:N-acetylneuraminate synthase family protein n=1 Tax=Campylobacter hyointestinalis TaxID=198 RepID=UPI000DCCBD3D|nr:N-acetylneuraminate synthase family protein [Campylobacter hyointestinalis]RAZ48979.1 N-acetylneuraminate synthase [Campylobacter hyointestinalis subsp. lawsonii]
MIKYTKPKVIAEIGCNHKGELEIAKELMLLAKESGADIAKFQKRNNKELLSSEQYNAPHPNPKNSYGDTYGAHREFLEFSTEEHKELQYYGKKIGIEYSTSVWDCTSAQDIITLNPSLIKIPSGCNTNYALLEILRDTYNGEIHISLGMTTKEEEKQIIELFKHNNKIDQLVLYACTSGYPIACSDACLLEILRIKELYGKQIKCVGYSGHHLGTNLDIAAYTLGAEYIERHFTKNKNWKGTDHSASLEPDELTLLINSLNEVEQALQYKTQDILDIEIDQRKKLKYGCYR